MLARLDSPRPRSRPSERHSSHPWLVLFGVALAVRVVVVVLGAALVVNGPRAPDWLPISSSLARGTGFSLGTPQATVATAAVPPLAPWIASGILRVDRGNPLWLPLAFSLLGALVPLVVAVLGMAVFGINVGRWAGWIAALDPHLILTPFSSDALIPLLVALAIACTVSWVKTPRPGRAFGVGLLWGAAALTHPAALMLPLGVVAWAWMPLGLTVQPNDRVRQIVLVLAGVALVVAPWTTRNATALRAFVPVSTGNGIALLAASDHRAWTDPALHGAPVPRVALAASHPTIATGGEARADRIAYGLAFDHAGEHPGEFLRLLVPRALAFLITPRPIDWILAVASLVLLPFAAWGAMRTLTGPRRAFQSFAVFALGWFLLRTLVQGAIPGARIPVEPLMVLLAGAGLDDLRLRLRVRSHGLEVIQGRR